MTFQIDANDIGTLWTIASKCGQVKEVIIKDNWVVRNDHIGILEMNSPVIILDIMGKGVDQHFKVLSRLGVGWVRSFRCNPPTIT